MGTASSHVRPSVDIQDVPAGTLSPPLPRTPTATKRSWDQTTSLGSIPENVPLAAPGVVSIQLVASVQVQNRPASTGYWISTATKVSSPTAMSRTK